MDWNDLPKQKRLLIFMLNRESSKNLSFTMDSCGDEVVANGISANKNALANMLYVLCRTNYIEKIPRPNGSYAYLLTRDGQDEAERLMSQCSNNVEGPKSASSLRGTEEHNGVEAYAKHLEQMIAGLKDGLEKLTSQPKLFNGLVKAQSMEIERLKAALKNAEIENDSLRVSKKMTSDAALCLDEEKTALRNERDCLQKSLYSIDGRRKALAKENEELSTKVAILKKSLSSTLEDLDKKNKKIEHLEDSIDKLIYNLTKMAEWARQMKNGSK